MKIGPMLALLIAFLVFGPAGHAQSPSPPGVSAARTAAERALRAGQFDQVESLAQAFPKDESLAVLRAQALIAKGEYAKADALLQPLCRGQAHAATPHSSWVCCSSYLGRRAEARRTLQLLLSEPTRRHRARVTIRAPARASRALGPVRGSERALPRGSSLRAERSRHRDGAGARCCSRNTIARKRRHRSRRRSRPIRTISRRFSGWPRRWPTTIRRRR